MAALSIMVSIFWPFNTASIANLDLYQVHFARHSKIDPDKCLFKNNYSLNLWIETQFVFGNRLTFSKHTTITLFRTFVVSPRLCYVASHKK